MYFNFSLQVSKQVKTTGSMPSQLSSLNSVTRIILLCSNSLSSMNRSLTVVVGT